MSNKKTGNEFEERVMNSLRMMGWWCHRFAQGPNGQPCDIIAVRDGEVWLLDAKHIAQSAQSFTFSRIEPNQATTFAYASQFGIRCGLAIRGVGNGIFLLRWEDALASGGKSIKLGSDRLMRLEDALGGGR